MGQLMLLKAIVMCSFRKEKIEIVGLMLAALFRVLC